MEEKKGVKDWVVGKKHILLLFGVFVLILLLVSYFNSNSKKVVVCVARYPGLCDFNCSGVDQVVKSAPGDVGGNWYMQRNLKDVSLLPHQSCEVIQCYVPPWAYKIVDCDRNLSGFGDYLKMFKLELKE